jgi:putative ABC transport system permease protein
MVHIGIGMITGVIDESTRLLDEGDYDAYITQRNKPNILMGGHVSDDIYEKVEDLECVEDIDRMIADWTEVKFEDEKISVHVIGFDMRTNHLDPYDIVEGNKDDLKKNNTIIVDEMLKTKSFQNLEVGDKIKGGFTDESLKVVGFCRNAHRTGNAVIWTNYETAIRLLQMENESTYLAVKIKDGYSVDDLKDSLDDEKDKVKAYSTEEMRDQLINFLLFDFGIAGSIGILAALGFVVAMIIISITLYQSVSEKIPEFVSLKALGAKKSYINHILFNQTFIIVSLSYILATLLAYIISPTLTIYSSLPVSIDFIWAGIIYGIALALGIICSVFSIRKVHKTDPAIIFRA